VCVCVCVSFHLCFACCWARLSFHHMRYAYGISGMYYSISRIEFRQ
jgi:hypothetical protein